MIRHVLILACAAALAGCKGSIAEAPPAAPPHGEGVVLAPERSPTVKPVGDALPLEHPPVELPPELHSRGPRRLSLAQLRGSLPVAFGKTTTGADVTWTNGAGASYFTTFSRALGEADYVNITEENLEPSPLYMKFMDDAARDVCDKALIADFAQPDAAKRTLLRKVALTDTDVSAPDAVDANLRYLKLRLHGIKVPDDDTATVGPLRALFVKAMAANTSNKVREGWRAVCVALTTAPEFHLY
ncbi:MAG: hypothetical protein ACK4N5_26945 [Myxococcales bacterium]